MSVLYKPVRILLWTWGSLATAVVVVFGYKAWLVTQSIFLRGAEAFDQVPSGARAIFAEGNGLRLACEFKISEQAFREWASTKGWTLQEISKPVRVLRYGGVWDAGDDRWWLEVTNGLVYFQTSRGSRFIQVVFDRDRQQGHYNYSRR
ncbi:MAG: hypothetical protein GXP27_22345 [Planctomycetes bacterium]|nr:hypothetical protein [Planctomycetota bacterium]